MVSMTEVEDIMNRLGIDYKGLERSWKQHFALNLMLHKI